MNLRPPGPQPEGWGGATASLLRVAQASVRASSTAMGLDTRGCTACAARSSTAMHRSRRDRSAPPMPAGNNASARSFGPLPEAYFAQNCDNIATTAGAKSWDLQLFHVSGIRESNPRPARPQFHAPGTVDGSRRPSPSGGPGGFSLLVGGSPCRACGASRPSRAAGERGTGSSA